MVERAAEGGGSADRRMRIQLTLTRFRALESEHPEPLTVDEFANPLIEAAHESGLTHGPEHADDIRTRFLSDCLAVMTRYFDDSLLAAVKSGTRQVVLLACGLDTRAYRLPWPPGTLVYEVDHPDMLSFKHRVLAGLGVLPRATQQLVGSRLSGSWQGALSAAGFDPDIPTAWLAEAIISNLQGRSRDTLFERVIELSALGSTIATDNDLLAASDRSWQAIRDAFVPHVVDALDPSALKAFHARTMPDEWLAGHGWLVATTSAHKLADLYGRSFAPQVGPHLRDFANRRFLTAMLPTDYLADGI